MEKARREGDVAGMVNLLRSGGYFPVFLGELGFCGDRKADYDIGMLRNLGNICHGNLYSQSYAGYVLLASLPEILGVGLILGCFV